MKSQSSLLGIWRKSEKVFASSLKKATWNRKPGSGSWMDSSFSQGMVISSTSEGREQNEMYQYRVWNRVLDHYSELEPQLEFTNEHADSYTVTAPKLSHLKITGELLSAHRRKELVTVSGIKLIIEGIYVW